MDSSSPHSVRAELLVAEGLYLVISLLCAAALGMRMELPYEFYQIAEPDWLSGRLAESLFYMHMQPPLMNAILGLALKLSRAAGILPEHLLLAVQMAMGAASVGFWAGLCRRMIAPRALRWAALLVFVFNPVLYVMLFVYFYPVHELAYLLAFACASARFLEGGRTRDFAFAAIALALLILTRALFHFAWGLAALGLLWRLAPNFQAREASSPRAARMAIYSIFFIALLAWPLKNKLLFDQFTYSTWLGYNLASGLPVENPDIPARLKTPPKRFAGIPILAERTEPHGANNMNFHPLISEFEGLGRESKEIMLARPSALAIKMLLNYWNFARFAGRHPYTGLYGLRTRVPPALAAWMRLYERALCLDGRSSLKLYSRSYLTVDGSLAGLAAVVFMGPALLYAFRARLITALPRFRKEALVPFAALLAAVYALALLLYRQSPYTREFSLFAPPGKVLGALGSVIVDLWPWNISGFMLLFPAVSIASARRVRRDWRADPIRARLALILLTAILWVVLMVLAIDGYEGNRMRFSTEPFWALLAFWLMCPAPEGNTA